MMTCCLTVKSSPLGWCVCLLQHLGVRLPSLMSDTGKQKISVCVYLHPSCTNSCITRLWMMRFWGACLPLWCCTSVPWADINSSGCCVQFCVCQRLGLTACRVKAFLRFFRSRAELDPLFSLSHKLSLLKWICRLSFTTDKNIHTISDCFGILGLRKW